MNVFLMHDILLTDQFNHVVSRKRIRHACLVLDNAARYTGINSTSRFVKRLYRCIGKYRGIPPAGLSTSDYDEFSADCNDLERRFANRSRKLRWIWMKLGRWG